MRHPQVRRIAFIGQKIQIAAAETGVKDVSLELGRKNALIAFPDTDPEAVAEAAVRGTDFSWSGQSCGSTSRLVVHRSLREPVVAGIMRRIGELRLGDPFDESTDVGALVSQDQYAKVLRRGLPPAPRCLAGRVPSAGSG